MAVDSGIASRGYRKSLQGYRNSLQRFRKSLQGFRKSLQGYRKSPEGARKSPEGSRSSNFDSVVSFRVAETTRNPRRQNATRSTAGDPSPSSRLWMTHRFDVEAGLASLTVERPDPVTHSLYPRDGRGRHPCERSRSLETERLARGPADPAERSRVASTSIACESLRIRAHREEWRERPMYQGPSAGNPRWSYPRISSAVRPSSTGSDAQRRPISPSSSAKLRRRALFFSRSRRSRSEVTIASVSVSPVRAANSRANRSASGSLMLKAMT